MNGYDILTAWGLRAPVVGPLGGYMPYQSSQEIVDRIIEEFNRLPVTYNTDPNTGQVVATRSMPKPYAPLGNYYPPEIATMFRNYFDPYWQAGQPNLWTSAILPSESLTGEKMLQRQTPLSDKAAATASRYGITASAPNIALQNPLTNWSESALDVPMISPGQGRPEIPMFGGTIDYTRGTWNTPPTLLTQPYGTFDPRTQRPPTLPAVRQPTMNWQQPAQTQIGRRNILQDFLNNSGIFG